MTAITALTQLQKLLKEHPELKNVPLVIQDSKYGCVEAVEIGQVITEYETPAREKAPPKEVVMIT